MIARGPAGLVLRRLGPLVLALLPSCGAVHFGLTGALWDAQRARSLHISDAALTEDGSLVVDIETSAGLSRMMVLGHSAEGDVTLTTSDGPLPSGGAVTRLGEGRVVTIDDPRNLVAKAPWIGLDPDHRAWGSVTLMVREGVSPHVRELRFARPIDWTRWGAWGAVVATPVTIVLDVVVIIPVEFVYCIATVGEQRPLFPFDRE